MSSSTASAPSLAANLAFAARRLSCPDLLCYLPPSPRRPALDPLSITYPCTPTPNRQRSNAARRGPALSSHPGCLGLHAASFRRRPFQTSSISEIPDPPPETHGSRGDCRVHIPDKHPCLRLTHKTPIRALDPSFLTLQSTPRASLRSYGARHTPQHHHLSAHERTLRRLWGSAARFLADRGGGAAESDEHTRDYGAGARGRLYAPRCTGIG